MAKITARGAREVARITATRGRDRFLYVMASDGRVLWRPAREGEHYTIIGKVPPALRTRDTLETLARAAGGTVQ